MILVGVGVSKNRDSYQAGYEATKRALEKSGASAADLVIAFSSVIYDQKELVKGIREASNNAPLVGCTSAGCITSEGPSQESVGVMVIQSDQIKFYTGLGKGVKEGAREAGRKVAEEVKAKAIEGLRVFIMFPDVLTGNGADTVRGVLDVLGPHFPLVGGAPGDDFLFKQTYEFRDDEVESGAVGGVGMSGNFTMGIGVRHGWVPIGLPMKATKSKGAVLYELDGKPAIRIYEDYFGENAQELRKEPLARMAITYPLGLKIPEYEEEYLIRDPITVDAEGAITCAAEIPEGAEIRLMIGSKEKAVEAAKDAARRVVREFQIEEKKPSCMLIFNCIAREKLFAQKAGDEINAIMEIVGPDVPLLGFYTYGEQAPLGGEVRNREKCDPRFYNETVVIFAIGE
ncbi:MAG: hypothetical protein G01um101433_846 [Parcubacteria group bacterium Gr01-1014_33]|nr:MAG: hypothetical protein G01um101433_846 [Parcubacteria group bacterium Gr01-1014_33]